MNAPKTSRSRWRAFVDAGRGVRFLFATQCHARWHGFAAIVAVALGWNLGISRGEWLAVILAITLVLVAEALNTALEQLGDAITQEHHPEIGRAKDMAAGAVLLASIGAATVGVVVFVPRLWALR